MILYQKMAVFSRKIKKKDTKEQRNRGTEIYQRRDAGFSMFVKQKTEYRRQEVEDTGIEGKFEIRSTKYETNSNLQSSNAQNESGNGDWGFGYTLKVLSVWLKLSRIAVYGTGGK